MLAKLIQEQEKLWDQFLPTVADYMKNSVHSTAKAKPFKLFFNCPSNGFIDYSQAHSIVPSEDYYRIRQIVIDHIV